MLIDCGVWDDAATVRRCLRVIADIETMTVTLLSRPRALDLVGYSGADVFTAYVRSHSWPGRRIPGPSRNAALSRNSLRSASSSPGRQPSRRSPQRAARLTNCSPRRLSRADPAAAMASGADLSRRHHRPFRSPGDVVVRASTCTRLESASRRRMRRLPTGITQSGWSSVGQRRRRSTFCCGRTPGSALRPLMPLSGTDTPLRSSQQVTPRPRSDRFISTPSVRRRTTSAWRHRCGLARRRRRRLGKQQHEQHSLVSRSTRRGSAP